MCSDWGLGHSFFYLFWLQDWSEMLRNSPGMLLDKLDPKQSILDLIWVMFDDLGPILRCQAWTWTLRTWLAGGQLTHTFFSSRNTFKMCFFSGRRVRRPLRPEENCRNIVLWAKGQAQDRQSTQQQPLEFDLLYIFVTVQDQ